MNEYMPTTQQVEDGFTHEPEYEYANPVGYGAHVRANRRAFKRWLAEVERAAAETAWDEGVAAAIEAEIKDDGYGNTQYPGNPYRRNEGENE